MKRFLIFLFFVSTIAPQAFALGGRKPKEPDYKYPTDLVTVGNQERENAKACIANNGMPLSFKKRLEMIRHPGERKFGRLWCWRSPEWNNDWVCGLTWNKGSYYLLEIGSNPNNEQVDLGTIRHEHGHYWLMSNYNDYSHNARLRHCFNSWHDINLRHRVEHFKNGDSVVVDYLIDPEYHSEF